MNKTFKRAGLVAGGVGAIASISLASFAFFTATTAISASGDTQTTKALDVTSASVGALRPGSCEDVTVTLRNTNDYPVVGIWRINTAAVQANGGAHGFVDLAPYLHNGATVQDQDATVLKSLYGPIDAGTTKTFVLPNAVCMGLAAPDSAQGQPVTVELNVSLKAANATEYSELN